MHRLYILIFSGKIAGNLNFVQDDRYFSCKDGSLAALADTHRVTLL